MRDVESGIEMELTENDYEKNKNRIVYKSIKVVTANSRPSNPIKKKKTKMG